MKTKASIGKMAPTRARLGLKSKIDVIKCFEKEKLSRDLANRVKRSKSLAANIVKDRRELLEMWQKNGVKEMKKRFTN